MLDRETYDLLQLLTRHVLSGVGGTGAPLPHLTEIQDAFTAIKNPAYDTHAVPRHVHQHHEIMGLPMQPPGNVSPLVWMIAQHYAKLAMPEHTGLPYPTPDQLARAELAANVVAFLGA